MYDIFFAEFGGISQSFSNFVYKQILNTVGRRIERFSCLMDCAGILWLTNWDQLLVAKMYMNRRTYHLCSPSFLCAVLNTLYILYGNDLCIDQRMVVVRRKTSGDLDRHKLLQLKEQYSM